MNIDSEIMTIKTYPTNVAIFLLFILAAIIYAIFTKNNFPFSEIVIYLGGIVLLACIFIKITITKIDRTSNFVSVTTITPLKRTHKTINFDEIKSIKLITGKGGQMHKGYICVATNKGNNPITTMGSLSRKKQEKLITDINMFIGRSINA